MYIHGHVCVYMYVYMYMYSNMKCSICAHVHVCILYVGSGSFVSVCLQYGFACMHMSSTAYGILGAQMVGKGSLNCNLGGAPQSLAVMGRGAC